MTDVGERVQVVVCHFGQMRRGSEGAAIGKVKRVTIWWNLADEICSHTTGCAWLGFYDDRLSQQRLEDAH
jgi:hypothetical protein